MSLTPTPPTPLTTTTPLEQIPGLKRFEFYSIDNLRGDLMEMTHSVYTHQQIYSQYCAIEEHIDCPPELVFEYMSNPLSLEEWSYGICHLRPSSREGVYQGFDKVVDDLGNTNTTIYCKTVSNREAMTVDYHCAWDQGDDLWMIYINRIIPAELVLKRPGSVVIWFNCHPPYYDVNPYQDSVPPGRSIWVGDLWDWFYAGHTVEMQNLKSILEYRYHNGLPLGPYKCLS